MKIIAYAYRPDETLAFEKFSKELNLDVTYVKECLSPENAHLAEGIEAVAILGNCNAKREVLEKLSKCGVKYLASRSAGYNNIDLNAAKELGIRVSNATYSPNSVADFATMLALMLNRRVIESIKRGQGHDYTLGGLMGNEFRNQTIGVIGTGRIGQTVIKNFSGFGCKILAYDLYPNEEMKKYVEYVDLDTLLGKADIITLHAPLFESNYHLINKETIAKMKDGVKIINTARGELIDTFDLIDGLKNGKIGGAGLDVIENELGIFHSDCRFKAINHDGLAILKGLPNVILTPHCAFYTDQAVSDMVECGLRSLHSFLVNGNSSWEISL
ncbi:D-isomer specific 2-hydroxyacid dehydrogenase family protein [uncultured Clostridium sp.]|uniref:D-isomer specific 2-hydroxyacid dehydrogenase family protein n=1 Tax=uncultured Clostridium sp. TaxID=59620 RepID=UPI0028E840A5|nr:D-isomer specific 2-hydroxyacid dehydrogenase family protein [uncultured Clostridium sp.]